MKEPRWQRRPALCNSILPHNSQAESHLPSVCVSGPSSISHEQRLSQSLDQALKSALEACPGFTAHRAQDPGSSKNAMQGGAMGRY